MTRTLNHGEIETALHGFLCEGFRTELQRFAREVLHDKLDELRRHMRRDIREELNNLGTRGYEDELDTAHGHTDIDANAGRACTSSAVIEHSTVVSQAGVSDDADDLAAISVQIAENSKRITERSGSEDSPSSSHAIGFDLSVSRNTSAAGNEDLSVDRSEYTQSPTLTHLSHLRKQRTTLVLAMEQPRLSNLTRVLQCARRTTLRRSSENGESLPDPSRIQEIMQDPRTEKILDTVMAILIVLNVVQIGVSSDVLREWDGWLVVDAFFALGFTIEFLMKILIHGLWGHLCGAHWNWSLFDAIVVVSAVVELVLTLIVGQSAVAASGKSLTLLRFVRLLRLTRLVKVLRFPFFNDLLMMFDGLVTGARTLFCAIVLLLMPMYASAVVLRETVGETTHQPTLTEPFTTLSWAFFTTFRCIMGDCSDKQGRPIPVLMTMEFGILFGISYFVMIVATAFGLFNVIIAIYVENIVAAARKNDAKQRQRQLSDEKRLNLLMAQLVHAFVAHVMGKENVPHFAAVDPRKAGIISITRHVFDKVTSTAEVHALFDQMDIAHDDRLDLFDVLDAEGNGALTLEVITKGLKKLRGIPRRSDIVSNGLVTRALQTECAYVRGNVKKLRAEVRQLEDAVRKAMQSVTLDRSLLAAGHDEHELRV